ncbi:MAG: BCAM0308 family protein [Desulfuromonadaceae bacterium]|nr:BCAM0308 family protein [Desulfuromonadaceae bacterium]
MATTIWKTEEKGQRTPRSLDAYQSKGGVGGAVHCECGAVFSNKRWRLEKSSAQPKGERRALCPACRRIADRNPAGIVSLKGSFFAAHGVEIDNLIKHTAEAAAMRNPLGRIMDINRGKEGVTITTTDAKLAQKIGREVFKSHGGELHYIWSHDENPVRVAWSR